MTITVCGNVAWFVAGRIDINKIKTDNMDK